MNRRDRRSTCCSLGAQTNCLRSVRDGTRKYASREDTRAAGERFSFITGVKAVHCEPGVEQRIVSHTR